MNAKCEALPTITVDGIKKGLWGPKSKFGQLINAFSFHYVPVEGLKEILSNDQSKFNKEGVTISTISIIKKPT